ncbi:MAG: hypothetical protein WC979_03125 [Candidatus Pacearchaeota archaeon]|jgi:hypothetical protein|nr:hypothetical protein [Clostridia bacterium]
MNTTESSLPFAMRIAAITTELDNIHIESATSFVGIKRLCIVCSYGEWEERLIAKCSKVLTKDIKKAKSKNPNAKLILYKLCEVVDHEFFNVAEMSYKFE